MEKFDIKIQKALGHYVYCLVDPFSDKIFYVGKASSNNRVFEHLKSSKVETEKTKKIKEIRLKNSEPRVEILRYGLESEEMAFEIEASIIDSLGLENLTNIVRGHKIEKGRLRLDEVKRLYGSAPVNIESIRDRYMTFFISKTYSTSLSESEIYDATRQFWSGVSKAKRTKNKDGKLDYAVALSIYDSVVIRVYSILEWFDSGSTFSTRKTDKNNSFEFVGNLIENHKLLGKKIINKDGSKIKALQQGYGYIN
jgi:hypothetical protein